MSVTHLRGLVAGAAAVAALVALQPSAANAQAQTSGTRFGVEAALGTNNNVGIGAGAFVKFHLAEISEHPITGRATFDYFFPSSSNFGGYTAHYWQIEADGLYDIVNKSSTTKPYIGAGITYSKWSYGGGYCNLFGISCSTSWTGLDFVGGLNFMSNSKLMPFVEAKIDVSGGSEFLIRAGIHF